MTTATSLGSSPTVNPFAAFTTDPMPAAGRAAPGGKRVGEAQAAGSLRPQRAAADKSTQVAFALPVIAAADALLIAGVIAVAYVSYINMTSEADREQVISEAASKVREMWEAIPGLVAPAIDELKREIRSLFKTMERAGADLNAATDIALKWVNAQFRGPAVPVPEVGRPDTSLPQRELYKPRPLPSYETLKPLPVPQRGPGRAEKPRIPPPIPLSKPEKPMFNSEQLGARLQKFAPKFGGVQPGHGFPLAVYEAQALALAAQYNRAGGDRVAICIKIRYIDPATKQSVDGILIYVGLDPSKVLTQFETFVKKLDASKTFEVIGDFGSMLSDVGLSIAGLQSRARSIGDVNFANGLPSAGGRRALAGFGDSNYDISKANVVGNNKRALALGRLDRIDLIVPCKQGRHFFLQGITRGQAAGLLNWAVRTGQLLGSVNLRDVIRANELDSVLGLSGNKVVPLTPAKTPPRSAPNPVSGGPMPRPSEVFGQPAPQPLASNTTPEQPFPMPSVVLGSTAPQRVGWINLSTRTFSATRHGAGDVQVTARFVTQRPTGPNVFRMSVNPTTGVPGKVGDPDVVEVIGTVVRLPDGGVRVDLAPGGGGNNKPPNDNKPPNNGGGPGKWNLGAIAGAAMMLGFALQSTWSMQVQTGRDSIGMSKIDLAKADRLANAALARLNKNSTPAQIKAVRREIWSAYLGVGVETLKKLEQNKLFNVIPMGRVLNGTGDINALNEGVAAYLKRLDDEPLPTATSNAGLGPQPNNIEIPGDATKTQHVEAVLKKAAEYAQSKVAQIPQRMTAEAGAAVGSSKPAPGEFKFQPFPVGKWVSDRQPAKLAGPKLLAFQAESRQTIYLHFLNQVTPRLKPAQRAAYVQTIAAWAKNDTQVAQTLISALGGLDNDALQLVSVALGQSKMALDELHRLAPNVALTQIDQAGQALRDSPEPSSRPGQPKPAPGGTLSVTPLPGRTPAPGALPTAPVQPKGDAGLNDAKAYRERLKAYTVPTLGYINAAMVPGATRLTTLSGFAPTEAMFVDKRLPQSEGLYQAAVKLKTLQDQIGSNFKVLSAIANDIARNPNRSSSPELQKLEQEIASLGKDWNKVGVLQNRIADRLRSIPAAPATPSTPPSITPPGGSPEPRTPQAQPSLNSQPPSSEQNSPPSGEPPSPEPLNSPTPQPAEQP